MSKITPKAPKGNAGKSVPVVMPTRGSANAIKQKTVMTKGTNRSKGKITMK